MSPLCSPTGSDLLEARLVRPDRTAARRISQKRRPAEMRERRVRYTRAAVSAQRGVSFPETFWSNLIALSLSLHRHIQRPPVGCNREPVGLPEAVFLLGVHLPSEFAGHEVVRGNNLVAHMRNEDAVCRRMRTRPADNRLCSDPGKGPKKAVPGRCDPWKEATSRRSCQTGFLALSIMPRAWLAQSHACNLPGYQYRTTHLRPQLRHRRRPTRARG